jgi:hypothetical protein
MLFLINKKQKEKILNEYYSSLINIFSFSLFCLFIVLAVFLFPTYLTMKVDQKIMATRVENLTTEMNLYKSSDKTSENQKIDNDISLLSASTTERTLTMYDDIKKIYQEVPNVKITSISIDILNKKILVGAIIDNKNTASVLVDKLNNSNYKGAELPYSVFSQNKSFVLNQNLTYE